MLAPTNPKSEWIKPGRLGVYALTVLFIAIFLLPQLASAETYRIDTLIGDGSKGRVFRKAQQAIKNKPVKKVSAKLRRRSGNKNTYVNIRFGSGGTLENGKRIHLTDENSRTVSWNVGNKSSNGKLLVLNAYKGEVQVDSITVEYHEVKSTPPKSKHTKPENKKTSSHHSAADDESSYEEDEDDEDAVKACRSRRTRIRRPRIEIGKVKSSGGLFSGKYRVRGSIFGNCIEEAGYFENGRLKKKFNVPLTDRYKRTSFEVRVRSGREGEIRVFTFDGREDSLEVDEEILRGEGLR